MSLTDIKTKDQGFTIVELLIVVVVIAILAAITIVSYNGITNRANASAAQSASASVQKKAEAYNAEKSQYPATFAAITTGASSSDTWYLTGVNESTTLTSTNGKNTVTYTPCGVASSGTAAPTNYAGISIYTGAKVTYFTFSGTSTSVVNVGQVSGTYTVGANDRVVDCFHN